MRPEDPKVTVHIDYGTATPGQTLAWQRLWGILLRMPVAAVDQDQVLEAEEISGDTSRSGYADGKR